VTFAVTANPDAAVRDGVIRIGSADFLVKQAPKQSTGTGPVISVNGIVNTASYTPDLAPGSLFSIFGKDLASTTRAADKLPLPQTFEGVTVEVIDGGRVRNAPLFYVSPGQLNGQMPYDVVGPKVQVRVRNSLGVGAAVTIDLATRAPRLFPWQETNAIVVHSDYSLVTAQAPAKPGEYLIAFLVGMGVVAPEAIAGEPGGDGAAAPVSMLTDRVTVTVGGKDSKVLFAGLAPYFVGLYQVNFQMPALLQSGPAAIQVRIGDYASQGGLSLACGTQWSTSTGQEIGTSGGTVRGGDLAVEIPAGALAAPAKLELTQGTLPAMYKGQLPGVWRLKGIPRETLAPITINLTPSAAAPAGRIFLLVRPSNGKGEMRIPVEVKGGVWTATLPPRTGRKQTTGESGIEREAQQDPDDVFEEAMMLYIAGYSGFADPANRYQVFYHPEDAPGLVALGWKPESLFASLNLGWNAAVQMGFGGYANRIWKNQQPLTVWLQSSSLFQGQAYSVVPWLWRDEYTLVVNPDEVVNDLLDPVRDQIAGDTAVMLMSMLQEPLVAKSPAWQWWTQAVGMAGLDWNTCEWTEFPPATALLAALTQGLEVPADQQQPPAWFIGNGATGFVEYLMAVEKASLPGEVFTQAQLLGAAQPSAVLKTRLASPGLGASWLEYIGYLGQAQTVLDCADEIDWESTTSSAFSPKLLEVLLAISGKAEATPKGIGIDLKLPDLSAMPILVKMPRSTEVEEDMFVTLQTADSEIKLLAASVDADGKSVTKWLQTGGRVSWEWRMGNQLWLWVVQTRSGQAGRKTPARVLVELTPKGGSSGNTGPWPAPGPDKFAFTWEVPIHCGDLQPPACGAKYLWFANEWPGVEVRWNYPDFTVTGELQLEPNWFWRFNVAGRLGEMKADGTTTAQGTYAFTERKNGQTQTLEATLSDLQCSKYNPPYAPGIECHDWSPANLTQFRYEMWRIDPVTGKDVLVGSGTPRWDLTATKGVYFVHFDIRVRQ
jgi:uncharacterized protein (TIGR03437 family)